MFELKNAKIEEVLANFHIKKIREALLLKIYAKRLPPKFFIFLNKKFKKYYYTDDKLRKCHIFSLRVITGLKKKIYLKIKIKKNVIFEIDYSILNKVLVTKKLL